jgi:conjugative relaxase-like TrwC/TraI family protein
MHGCPRGAGGRVELVALPVKALKAGQEAYWLDQIARNREAYFSGRGESPGRFVGSAATAAGLEGVTSPEQVRAMFQGLDPATRRGPLRAAVARRPTLQAGRRTAAGGAQAARQRAGRRGPGAARQVQGAQGRRARRPGCLPAGRDQAGQGGDGRAGLPQGPGPRPRELYGEGFDRAWQHRGKRVNERVQAFDHCFSSPKSVSLLAAGGSDHLRKQVAEARADALEVGIGYLEHHGIGVRRDHNGTDRHHVHTGVLAVAFEHRLSRAGDPQFHTHVLVQNAVQGPDGRWTALDSDRLYAHLMAADHLYLAAERAALTERLGVRWGPVDARSGAAEIISLDDRRLIERFSKRSEQLHEWLAEQGLSGIKASSAAAIATRAPKDHGESEQSVYARWARELAVVDPRGLPPTLTWATSVCSEPAWPRCARGPARPVVRTGRRSRSGRWRPGRRSPRGRSPGGRGWSGKGRSACRMTRW